MIRVLLAAALIVAGMHHAVASRLSAGSGSFEFPVATVDGSRLVKVWYHRPAGTDSGTPIVFVMHGTDRNGESYRKHWIPFAEVRRFVLLVPEFSRARFAGRYNLERLTLRDGTRIPLDQWPYAAIERIFDAVRAANEFRASTYDIYGHSAGGQFVHRLALLLPEPRYRIAVVANSGWYTMPDFGISYPYGLADSNVTPAQLARTLRRRLIVLLGDEDTDPDHPTLRRASKAMVQGEHRYARGLAFFERSRRAAAEANVPHGWALHIAPGAGHSNARMAPHAAPFVGGREP